jgi:hypothetical protein
MEQDKSHQTTTTLDPRPEPANQEVIPNRRTMQNSFSESGDSSPIFYTYLWLRGDGTPYYVGKGSNGRAYEKHEHNGMQPPAAERVIIQGFELEEDAFFAEKFLISFYGRKDLGTGCLRNLTDGGEGTSGVIRSSETLARMSAVRRGKTRSPEARAKTSASLLVTFSLPEVRAKLIGRKASPETRAKIGAALLGNQYALGYKHTPETRAKLSVAQPKTWLGRKHIPETRAKMRAVALGRALSPKTRAKIGAAHRGKTNSLETRAKISASNVGKIMSPEARAKISAARLGTVLSPLSLRRRREKMKNKKSEYVALYKATVSQEQVCQM